MLAERYRQRQGERAGRHVETIGTRLAADLAVLRALPMVALEACEQRPGRVSSTALVRYRGNDYSVPSRHGHGLRHALGGVAWRRGGMRQGWPGRGPQPACQTNRSWPASARRLAAQPATRGRTGSRLNGHWPWARLAVPQQSVLPPRLYGARHEGEAGAPPASRRGNGAAIGRLRDGRSPASPETAARRRR